MLPKFFLSIILLSFCIPIVAYGVDINETKGIYLLESSDDGATIKFQPQSWLTDTLRIDGEEYLKLDFLDASFNGNPGEPIIPTMTVSIGIPIEAEVTHSIIETKSSQTTGKLLPWPHIINENNLDRYRYVADESIYSSTQIYPSHLIEISNPVFFRDQRLVTINFYPVQCIPASNKIRLYHEITVGIDFTGNSNKNSSVASPPKDDVIYKDIIINYDRSKNWKKIHSKSLKKYHSMVSDGRWFKIYIKDEGIYKIDGSLLADFGIDIKSIDPQTLKIYNNGGRELDRNMNTPRPDSLIENAIIINDGGDGVFDILDEIIFYGRSVNNWKYNYDLNRYEHYINHYENYNIYWLSWGGTVKGKRMQFINCIEDKSLTPVSSFTSPYYFEQEIINFLNSGLDWYSRFFTTTNEYSFTVNLLDAIPTDTFFKFSFVGWASSRHTFTVYVNGMKLDDFSSYGIGDFQSQKPVVGFIQAGYNDIKIKYDSNKDDSQAYLDWFEILYNRKFVASNNYLQFYLPPTSTSQKYTITGFTNSDIKVFDITNYDDVKLLSNTAISNNEVSFVDNTNFETAKKMITLTPSAYKIPERFEETEFRIPSLRNPTNGADLIIITHDDFVDAIKPLAQHREIHDSLTTEVIKITDIYDEFSWGLFDPTAIRDFIKYAYDNWSIPPIYVLLCGDGDYDYKNIVSNQDKNWIPPYETTELDKNNNRARDDWFVCVSGNDNYPDLAFGRLPTRSAEETKIIVDKIITYETAPLLDENDPYGIDDWRNIVTMVGDDELIETGAGNETIHTSDAERIIENRHYVPNKFNKRKIYLTEYPAVRNTSYFSILLKPTATIDIFKQINQGTLIMNYVGHGNPTTWSHEYVVYAPRDFEKIQNGSKLAFWIAATCDFGRFDDPAHQSLAEDMLTAAGRGAIGVIASTRLAFATDNAAINRSFYVRLFQNQKTSERLGLALIKAKMDNYSNINEQKYTLLGDPTMRLAVPRFNAKITSVQPDSIKALSRITVTGYIENDNTNFEGKVLLKAFDSKKKRTYITASNSTLNYILSGNTIFRGVDNIHAGHFEISFIVPKDITYGGNLGRVSIYFANKETNGSGYQDSLIVGGTSSLLDNEGPMIDIGFQNQKFFNKGFVSEVPILKMEISDSASGVNIVGDIGHNITMIVDRDEENKVILTELFRYNEGSYTTGTVLYDFRNFNSSKANEAYTENQAVGLQSGEHQIEIKAWDNSNNSSIAHTDFVVVSNAKLELTNVLNYPNPFSRTTTFSFWTSQFCLANIKIYTVAGRLIKKFAEFPLEKNQLAQVEWDGRDEDGDLVANGIYFYKVIAKANLNGDEQTREVIEKLVIMR